jgi:hypothetical protein
MLRVSVAVRVKATQGSACSPDLQGYPKRLMGLELTTFCMASSG